MFHRLNIQFYQLGRQKNPPQLWPSFEPLHIEDFDNHGTPKLPLFAKFHSVEMMSVGFLIWDDSTLKIECI